MAETFSSADNSKQAKKSLPQGTGFHMLTQNSNKIYTQADGNLCCDETMWDQEREGV